MPDDLIRPFQVESTGVRGRLVRLGPTADEIIRKHDYPPLLSSLLGEALALAAALASALKFDGLFTLQAKGEGPVRILVADYVSPGEMRGYLQFDRTRLADAGEAASVPRLFGRGHLALTIDPAGEGERYQGIVALEGTTLADCSNRYFRASEQLDASFRAACGAVPAADGGRRWRAGALMLQRLPAGDPAFLARGGEVSREETEDAWRRSVTLMATASDAELLDPSLDPDQLLYRIYHAEGVRVFEPSRLRFGCRCSEARARNVLASLEQKALEDLAVDGRFVVTCGFCNSSYVFLRQEFLPPAAGLTNA
ncbi:MAG: molecular chaperone [Alphaproteobacteria bacterium]|nr:molecular chaperone [Alphaproteobacteria bacterium]